MYGRLGCPLDQKSTSHDCKFPDYPGISETGTGLEMIGDGLPWKRKAYILGDFALSPLMLFCFILIPFVSA